jgi:AcrR family transcriptional regulator
MYSENDNSASKASTMKVGQRREREIAHARTDIVEAAITAFSKVGLHNATMQDIAREAGYTAASLYTYFKSKQEIVDAMVTLLTDEYIHVFDEPLPLPSRSASASNCCCSASLSSPRNGTTFSWAF